MSVEHGDDVSLPPRLDGGRPGYRLTRSIFLRLLGVVFLIAFVSLWVQIDGLIGGRGILPVGEFLERVRSNYGGGQKYWLLPTLCWLDASDAFLHTLCGGGVVLSVLLVAGVLPVPVLVLLTADYLSLTVAGQVFLGYQWDALLIETGFLAIFFAPLSLTINSRTNPPVPWAMLFMLRWLLFRVMFMSGVVKLASGDPAWRGLTAMAYHYWTQPLPAPTSWWMSQLPMWFAKASTAMTFVFELPLPLLIFAPWRRVRYVALFGTVALQVLIAATGNYGFFNLLAIVLCIPLVEDRSWPAGWVRRVFRWKRAATGRERSDLGELPATLDPGGPLAPIPDVRGSLDALAALRTVRGWRWPVWISAPIAIFLFLLTLIGMSLAFGLPPPPRAAMEVYRAVLPLDIANNYGLFAVMTTRRPEIIIEGSDDGGVTWKPYVFKYKPGPTDRRPVFCTPHMPRLDWQMWFAALDGDYHADPWLVSFVHRLLEGSPPVLGLLKSNPFPDHPPEMIRARLFDYHFTDSSTRRATGDWWTRAPAGEYLPPVTLRSFAGA